MKRGYKSYWGEEPNLWSSFEFDAALLGAYALDKLI